MRTSIHLSNAPHGLTISSLEEVRTNLHGTLLISHSLTKVAVSAISNSLMSHITQLKLLAVSQTSLKRAETGRIPTIGNRLTLTESLVTLSLILFQQL